MSKGFLTYQNIRLKKKAKWISHNGCGQVISLDQALDQLVVNVAFGLKLF